MMGGGQAALDYITSALAAPARAAAELSLRDSPPKGEGHCNFGIAILICAAPPSHA